MASELRVNNIKNRSGLGTVTFADEGLVISGITSLSLGDTSLIVGSGTSTGTADQKLQVTGGAYVSGNLGVGVTSPGTKIQVINGTPTLQPTWTSSDVAVFGSSSGTSSFVQILSDTAGGLVYSTPTTRARSYLLFNTDGGQSSTWLNGGTGSLILNTNGTERVRIDSSGNLGIATATPSEKLHVIGNIIASGNVSGYSDKSLKDNIQTIPNALDKVSKLRGVEFDRNDIEGNPHQIGVIAQEVEKIIPEVITTHNDGLKSVSYGNLVGLLIEAIKDLKEEVNELKARLEEK